MRVGGRLRWTTMCSTKDCIDVIFEVISTCLCLNIVINARDYFSHSLRLSICSLVSIVHWSLILLFSLNWHSNPSFQWFLLQSWVGNVAIHFQIPPHPSHIASDLSAGPSYHKRYNKDCRNDNVQWLCMNEDESCPKLECMEMDEFPPSSPMGKQYPLPLTGLVLNLQSVNSSHMQDLSPPSYLSLLCLRERSR